MMKRTMRPGAILVLALAGIAGSAAAVAGEPQVNAKQLAIVERALEFCGPFDPDSSKKLREKVAHLVKGASPDALARARGSEDYQKAYSTMGSFIAEIDARNAKVACANTADK